jgi:ligand-binding sensor domain-containing protein
LLHFSCNRAGQENNYGHKANNAQEGGHYIVTSLGDSIPSGVPLPARGKPIDPASVAKPKTAPLKELPKEIPIPTNIHPVGVPEVITIPQKPGDIIIGENGVPFPTTVPALGDTVDAIQPQQRIAGLPQMKKEAIANLQFWNIEQGMNAAEIRQLMQDSRGDLWIITVGGGVIKFDGNHFTHYTIKEGLPFNDALTMMEDSRGNIWIGGFQGLVQYDGHQFIYYAQKNGLSSPAIYSMLEDKNGHLWFGSNGQLCRFDPGLREHQEKIQATFTHYNFEQGLMKNLPIKSLHEDRQGNLWIGTIWAGLFRFQPSNVGMGGTFSHYHKDQGFANMGFSSILDDENGGIWLGTSRGVYQMDVNSGSYTQYTTNEGLSGNSVNAMLKDSQGNLWFGTNNGACKLNFQYGSGTFTHLN